MAQPSIREIYKGYEIRKHSGNIGGYTSFFCIFKDGVRISQICLHTTKACRNVIDTHERFVQENAMPITIQ